MTSSKTPRHDRQAKAHATEPRTREARLLPPEAHVKTGDRNAVVHCGWGRLLFAQTFESTKALVDELKYEREDERDIAIYVQEPHVAVSFAPHEIFLDPSHTYRLWLQHYRGHQHPPSTFLVRSAADKADARAINAIYAKCGLVQTTTDFVINSKASRRVTVLVAEDEATGNIIGTVMGVDHRRAFDDPENGSSLWCLAVDPDSSTPKVGEMLLRHLAEQFQARARSFMDLSVMHDNTAAINLYERLNFQRIQSFTLKYKNPLNERLYIAPQPEAKLNPYARIIINEARRRGIGVDIEDVEANIFTLTHGGRRVACRESLSELTSAVAMTRCDDKGITRRLLSKAGLKTPDQLETRELEAAQRFLRRHERVVVKPARGEAGAGITVDVRSDEALETAIETARRVSSEVIVEAFHGGDDLRIIVIGGEAVAAAIRKPAEVYGDGESTLRDLIRVQSRRRSSATGGESRIPIDAETERCVAVAGYTLDDVPEKGAWVQVRKTANLHTGGTLIDVTADVHETLKRAAIQAASVLDIPVAGLDLIVPDVTREDYVIIEANERPGLANHEPQPTAERFIDLLFPQTVKAP